MNKLTLILVVAVVVGGISFYGGMKYAQGKISDQRQQFLANAGSGFRGNGQGGQGRGGMMGFVNGEIIAKDDKSVTVKLRDGGSKIVFYSNSTEVGKFVSGTLTDLKVGENISANGSPNSDGSITAQSVQIRPTIPGPSQTPNQ